MMIATWRGGPLGQVRIGLVASQQESVSYRAEGRCDETESKRRT